jgi:hypothetical protein
MNMSFWFRYTLLKRETNQLAEVAGIFTRRETKKSEKEKMFKI